MTRKDKSTGLISKIVAEIEMEIKRLQTFLEEHEGVLRRTTECKDWLGLFIPAAITVAAHFTLNTLKSLRRKIYDIISSEES